MAVTFVPLPPNTDINKMYADHVNQVCWDDRADNMEWVTGSVNQERSNSNKTLEERRKSRSYKNVIGKRMVCGTEIMFDSAAHVCREFGTPYSGTRRGIYKGLEGCIVDGWSFRYKEFPDLPGEIWVDLKGGRVSNQGRVRTKYGVPTYGHDKGSGYRSITFDKKNYSVHRLVCEAFCAYGRLEQDQVDHIDKDITNNNAYNLRWCTNTENQRFKNE